MFCSNCGKSLKQDDKSCPYCGMSVGESRFASDRSYTGAQTVMRPGHAVRVPDSYGSHYTTDYAVDDERASEPLPSDAETSYRAVRGAGISGYDEDDRREPLYNSEDHTDELDGDDIEEEEPAPRREPARPFQALRSLFMRQEEEESGEEESGPEREGDEELSEDERRAIGAGDDEDGDYQTAGISEGVRKVMSELREEYDRKERQHQAKEERKAARRRAYEEEGEQLPGFEDDADEDILPDHEDESSHEDAEEEGQAEPPQKQKPAKEKTARRGRSAKTFIPKREKKKAREEEDFEDFDEEEAEDEFDEDLDEEFTDESISYELKREKRVKVLRYVLAALLLVLVICLAIWGLGQIDNKTKTAPVEEVTLQLWNDGVELMQERVGSAYRRRMLALYNPTNPETFVDLSIAMTQDLDNLSSLMPTEPLRNDSRFINALKAIQESINNCLSNDALAFTDTTRTSSQKDRDSDAMWQTVRDLVSQLSRSTNQGMLDAIIKHEKVELIAQATPEPDPTPTPVPYQTLAKGASGTAVINLQTRLSELGYLSGAIDGEYGSKTKTAVQKFQEKAGIKADGIAGVETQERLFAPDAPAAK